MRGLLYAGVLVGLIPGCGTDGKDGKDAPVGADDTAGDDSTGDDTAVTAADVAGGWVLAEQFSTGDCAGYGYPVHVDPLTLAFEPDGDDGVTASGSEDLAVGGDTSVIPLSLVCEFDAGDITCQEYAGEGDTFWTFAGTYAEAAFEATVDLTLPISRDATCTVELSYTGARG